MAKSMIDDEFQKILKQYKAWTGSRAELLAIIQNVEEADPNSRMLQSKKAPYNRLPVNPRRIQWFISQGMVPKPFGHKYEYLHLVYYWATIFARKRERLQFDRLKNLLDKMSLASAEKYIVGRSDFHESLGIATKNQSTVLVNVAGEKTGTARSTVVQFGLSSGCYLNISENQLSKLTEEDVDFISARLQQCLLAELHAESKK